MIIERAGETNEMDDKVGEERKIEKDRDQEGESLQDLVLERCVYVCVCGEGEGRDRERDG